MEDLVAQSPIICTGRVIELVNTLEKSAMPYPGLKQPNTVATEIWLARIKVLGVSKGKVPDEIELRFAQIDSHPADWKSSIICDGPELLALQADARYRFYLKPVPGKKLYLGSLDGNFDEFPAAEPLAPDEADNLPPLLEEDARKLAIDSVNKIKIDSDASQWRITSTHEASVDDVSLQSNLKDWKKRKGWTFTFGWEPDHEAGGPEPGAIVEILADGKIDPSSWIALAAAELKPHHLGLTGHIIFRFPLTDSFADYYSVVGRISKISGQNLEITNAQEQATSKPGGVPRSWPTLIIPLADIQEVKFIPD